MVYLDYSAHTPASREVIETFCRLEASLPGNANSAHPLGARSAEAVKGFSRSIAGLLGVGTDEIIYTSGATESNNAAVKGIAAASRHIGRHILTTPLEHPSVSAPLTSLQEKGYEVEMLRLRRDGTVDLEELRELLRDDTVLVTVTAVDSELGVVQPVREIYEIMKEEAPLCRLHVDATQAVGKIPFSFECGDTFSLSAHKFYGLLGSGLLIRRNDTPLEPLIEGGSSTSIYRSGTPAHALNGALECALRNALEYLEENHARVKELNVRLRERLGACPLVRINSPEDAIPHILNVTVRDVRGRDFQRALAERDICVSVKSACSSDLLPSRAVMAVTGSRKDALSSWRISLGPYTTDEEVETFMKAFDECCAELTER